MKRVAVKRVALLCSVLLAVILISCPLDNQPQMTVTQGGSSIPTGTGSHDFGEVIFGLSSPTTTFVIQNTGSGTLILTESPAVVVSGTDAASFTVDTQPATTVLAGTSTTFTIIYAPDALGGKVATISIANNDPNGAGAPYTFTVVGTAPWVDDFEDGASGWSMDITSTCDGSNTILGGYAIIASGSTQITVAGLPAHTMASAEFDFIPIDS